MEELLVRLIFNLNFNIIVSTLAFLTYLFNYFILKMKQEYKGLGTKHLLTFIVPGFNVLMLMYNLMLLTFCSSGYRIVKPRRAKYVKTKGGIKA